MEFKDADEYQMQQLKQCLPWKLEGFIGFAIKKKKDLQNYLNIQIVCISNLNKDKTKNWK